MSGRDETVVPPGREGTEPPPYPRKPASPRFGRADVSAKKPLVTPQAADAPAGELDHGPPAPPDAEESMNATPPRRGSSVPDAEKTMTGPPTPYDAAPSSPQHTQHGPTAPYGARTGAGETTGMPAAEKTVTDVLEPEETAEESTALTLAGRTGGTEPPPAAETTIPPLMPDAIIPPGVAPEAPIDDPDPEPEMDGTRPTPSLGAGGPHGPFPGGHGPGMPPPPGRMGGANGRRAVLLGGGALAAILLGGGAVLAYTTTGGGDDRHAAAHRTHPAPPPRPTPTPSKTKAKHRPKPKRTPTDIRDEKKDPKPLTVTEVFPHDKVKIAGRTFLVKKTVLNNHCDLAANGDFRDELTRQHCRSVVRATFVSDDKKIAVTAGIAAMPTDAAAMAALKAQDPAHYEWFRGMKADGAPKIDQGGGYATSVRRGRYICFAYAMYADAHKPKKGDKTLKQVATGFRDLTLRPINRRARQH